MKYERIIQRTIDWIEEHLHEPITADDVAGIASFSKFHFHRVFQSELGISFSKYIRLRRLTNAASSLIHSDENVLTIALYYQFDSQEAFTRAFKQLFHIPPGRYRKVMREMFEKKEELVVEEKIKGWFLSGSNPYNYELDLDYKTVHQGKAAGFFRSKANNPGDFGTMMQQFKADKYIGKRLKLTGFLKTEDVAEYAGMWMRIDNKSEDILQFDNMNDRPIAGTTNWTPYSIVLDVPEQSAIISFGVLLYGTGKVWVDNFKLEEADESTPTTHIDFGQVLLDEPINLTFED
ncbi:AraC-type DNA-binding protein [Gracilibacillus ureilyticus]|uniref:AraC-type DNA-binding protein n=1 Tax=Gracilibacillus ureilyticus TaxID=531814 RepID=A0A1H9Q5H9_9BACI|nr:AraC family transcriptional regulator [Gracilibacillus ureilyticus]SER55691.1 AraC-type DNA-binding protein [Gracilibacillus ureilyticus]